MTLSEGVITILVLSLLAIIGYCKFTNKSLIEFASELKEIFSSSEEIIQPQGGLDTLK